MLLRMLERLLGIVVMQCAVGRMMMAGALYMIEFMGNAETLCLRYPDALHGKTVQGQQDHQQKAKIVAHGVGYFMSETEL